METRPQNASPEHLGALSSVLTPLRCQSDTEAFPPHLSAWVEASGDLWKRPALLAPGAHRRQFAEELLDAHVEAFGDGLDDVETGAPERSSGGPCQSLEQVGNGDARAGSEALSGGVCPDLGNAVPRAGGSAPGGRGPLDGGAALLAGLAGGPRARGDRGRPGTFGGRAYTAASPEHCQAGAWSLGLTSKTTGEWVVARFRCRSWRCSKCAPAVNRRDAERIEDALGPVQLDQVLFLTLTFDRTRYGSAADAWRACRDAWKRLRDTLAYRYGEGLGRGTKKARLVYVQTWEQHRDGWPHVHVLLWSEEIAADVRRNGSYQRTERGEPRPIWRWGRSVLRKAAMEAGFGPILDVQFPRKERGALASYLVKLAAELTGSAKKDQTPVDAPKGFRRIRATPKFLEPARRSSGEFAGELLLAPFDAVLEELDRGAETFHAAAEIVKGRIDRWLRPNRAPTAARCSTPADTPHTALVLTA